MTGNFQVFQEDFPGLEAYYADADLKLKWDLVFTLPAWLKAWWLHFGAGAELYLRSVRRNDKIIGIAPLQIRNGRASIVGSPNVCDYQDFITLPGAEGEFFSVLLDDMHAQGIKSLDIEPWRANSAVAHYLIPMARERKYDVIAEPVDVSMDMDLPDDWEKYLGTLNGKQRHELRRKMRNLQEAGEAAYHVIEDKSLMPRTIKNFLQLFPEYRRDKAKFMTLQMQAFFSSMAESLAEYGVLRFGALEYAEKTTAMIMYFDYRDNIYLYNSAYMPEYKFLSVGLISKAKCIQDSIEKRKKTFDFLKGPEQYKRHLGGKEIVLFRCSIDISSGAYR